MATVTHLAPRRPQRVVQDAPRRRWPLFLLLASFPVSWLLIYVVIYAH
ncbi:MAG TPA: hypothetical protein VFQ53_06680 [Kofleriaceae bacterium]|nr:hypothetical protein [Kofleriaceae bacterium]